MACSPVRPSSSLVTRLLEPIDSTETERAPRPATETSTKPSTFGSFLVGMRLLEPPKIALNIMAVRSFRH